MPRYLIRQAVSHDTFRLPELESLAELEGVTWTDLYDRGAVVLFDLSSDDDARRLVRRSILTRGVYELLGEGDDLAALHASIRAHPRFPHDDYRDVRFRYRFETVNETGYTLDQQRDVFMSLAFLDWRGQIDMKTPEQVFWVIVADGRFYFARHVADGGRHRIRQYSLKTRHYIGNTSMESEVSLISANMALARSGALVYDPFCGTGSFLITAAAYGAVVLGSDIDGRAIRGTPGSHGRNAYSSRKVALHAPGTQPSIVGSFAQYDLTRLLLDCVVCDVKHPPWRDSLLVDAILTDPPYGVRAGARTVGRVPGDPVRGRHDTRRENYVPPSKPYELADLVDDLLLDARARLREGGRLSFWLPTKTDEYRDVDVPQCKGMHLLYNSVEGQGNWSRRLLTYVKASDLDIPIGDEKQNKDGRTDRVLENGADGTNGHDQRQEVRARPAHYQFREKYFAGFH